MVLNPIGYGLIETEESGRKRVRETWQRLLDRVGVMPRP